jgi:dihydroorotase
VSRGSKGELLADIAELHSAGCAAITDDGHPTATALLLRRALEYAGMFGMPVIEHCEDSSLKGDGVAHEGFTAATLGLRGMPGACEAMGVERGVLMAELTGGAFHVAHMSARASIRAVRKAKEAGIRVTCEVAPHHFTLTDESLRSPIPYDTNTKMNPPLRESADRDAMLDGIADGTVDVIATDHAPHHYDEKNVEFDRAPFGIVGLETAVPLAVTRLVDAGRITLPRMIELMSTNPARLLKLPGGTLSVGAPADLTILAPEMPVRIDARRLRSRSKNTPFDGWELRGGVVATMVNGRTVYVNDDAALRMNQPG